MPVDISGDFLHQDAARLHRDFPHLAICPVVVDFTAMTELPPDIAAKPRAGFFPGSTVGNFEPHEAAAFLRRAGQILGNDAVLVVGVDLEKLPTFSTGPTTTPRALPRNSISICSPASTASWGQISIWPPSSTTPSTTANVTALRCTSPA